METLNRLPFKARRSVFNKLEKIVDIAALSKDEREKYDESIKVYRDNLAVLSCAKREGHEEGREEGIEIGSNNKAMSIASKMKADGLPFDVIAKYSELPIETIEKL